MLRMHGFCISNRQHLGVQAYHGVAGCRAASKAGIGWDIATVKVENELRVGEANYRGHDI